MPLHSATRQEAPAGAHNLASLKQTDEIFLVAASGEAVKHYGDLLDKQHAYSLATWTDRYSGRSKLTYQEALALEKIAEKQLRAQFPKHLEGEAVKLIHHSVLRKDDLVNKLYETIKVSKTGDEDQKPATDQQQQQLPAEAAAQAANVTKKLLNHFLIYVADKQKPGVWVCKDPWVQKYGLATELPSNLQTATVPASPAREGSQGSKARDSTPMKSPNRRPSASSLEQPRTLEEEEARLKPGTLKALAFAVMKQRGVTAPVSLEDIVRITTTDGSRIDWPDKSKRTLANVLREDSAFIRVTKGVFTLRCWAAELPPQQDQGAAGASGGAKDAPAAAGKDTADAGEQQSGLARAELVLAQTQKAVAARKADAEAAAQALEASQKRLDEAKEAAQNKPKQTPAPSAGSSNGELANGVAPSPSKEELDAKFALPARLKEYTGPEGDRKAKVAWRQEKAAEEKRLAQERASYLQQQRLAAAKTARAGTEQLQAAVDRAKKEAEEANAKLGKVLKAEADALRAVEREKQREMLKDLKEKSKADREKQKQADKELREKRKQEALAAKRYPMDDLELLSEELTAAATAALADAASDADTANKLPAMLLPAEQTDLACLSSAEHLDEAASQHVGKVLYVADTLSQFSKQLGLKGCSMAELQATLDAVAAGAAVGGAVGDGVAAKVVREALAWLACTYQGLLKVLVRDVTEAENAARVFSRWEEVIEGSAGAWPEVMRRWIMLQAQEGLAAPAALSAAEYLHKHDAGQLSPQQHLALLTQLLDDVMDTSLIRDLLAHRLEEAQEAAAGLREQLTEARRHLREVMDEEKEHKKKRRAAALALATAAAERQLREQGQLAAAASAGADAAAKAPAADAPAEPAAAAGNAPADGDAVGASGGQGGKKGKAFAKDKEEALLKAKRKEIMERAGIADKATVADVEAELADLEEVEPTWELPAELQEYSGPAGDKKAMSEFRRKQQDERKRLDKAKTKWHSEQSKRARERAEAKRRELEEDKRLAKERQRVEEEVAELQDRLEQQEGRYAVRRQPLGADRFNRSYWWGLAGNKDALLLQQEVGGAEATLELLAAAAKDAAVATAAGPSAADMMASVFAGCSKTPGSAGKVGSTADADAADAGQAGSSAQQQRQGRSAGLDHKGLMLDGGPEGWAMLIQPDQVEALMGACEVRGVREKELKASLEKVLPSLSTALTKAAAAKAAAAAAVEDSTDAEAPKTSKSAKKKKEPEALAPRALPSRHARSAAAEQIRKTGTAAGKAKDETAAAATALAAAAAAVGGEEEETGPFSGWQLAAVKSAVSSLDGLCQPASAAKVSPPAPSNTWNQYAKALHGLIAGDVPESWQNATTAAAIELLTGKPQAGCSATLSVDVAAFSGDAAWARAVAAAGATPADAHGDDDAATRHVVLGQLRLQLLQVEQQLVAATGEGKFLSRGADGVFDDDEHAEGVEESSEGEAGQPAPAAAGELDAMDVDDADGADEASLSLDGGKASKGGAAKAGKARQGVKRAASSNSLQAGASAADAAAPYEEEPAAKRRRDGTADAAAAAAAGGRKGAGLPPLPAPRGRGRASATGQAGDTSQPPSRQTSLAPANSGALPAAAAAAAGGGGGSRGQKRGRRVSHDVSHEGEGDDDEGEVQTSRGKKQAGAKAGKQAGGKGKAGAAMADSMEVTEDGSEDGLGDEEAHKSGRKSLAHLRAHLHEQGVDHDPDEEVAEEADPQPHLPFRLKGKTIWHTPAEREAWRAAVGAAATAASLAYCAAALAFHAQGPLQVMADKSKGSKQKQLPAPAQQQQAGSSRGGAARRR